MIHVLKVYKLILLCVCLYDVVRKRKNTMPNSKENFVKYENAVGRTTDVEYIYEKANVCDSLKISSYYF